MASLAAGTASAQTAAKSAQDLAGLTQAPSAPLSTYVQVVSGDSFNLFYTNSYEMAQPACAAIRRQTRLDATGSFHGAFRDTRWPDTNSVELTGRYVHGQKEGLFTLFHANGKPQGQGQYHANRRIGEWQFWRASGQLAEIISYDRADEQPVIRQYWDAAGQQMVIDGAGTWQRELGSGNQFSGPVVAGRPLGIWKLVPAKNGAMANYAITETYGPDGTVKAGFERTATGTSDRYHGASRVQFFQVGAFESAERFQMRPPCAPPTPVISSTFAPAFYKTGTSAYFQLLWRRIQAIESSANTPHNTLSNYQGVLRFEAYLDANGSWSAEPFQTEGTSIEAARQLLALMRTLPRWEPAHESQQAVGCRVQIEYGLILDQMHLRIQPGRRAAPAPIPDKH
ncbi:toxin-antitoxin system YwqK family antitoxin [Hymenobacter agri]